MHLNLLATSTILMLGSVGFLQQNGGQSTTRPAQASEQQGHHGEHGEEVFHEAMEQAGSAWRNLRNSSFDESSRESDLQAIMTLEAALMQAKSGIESLEMSPRAREEYGEDRAAFEKAVRLQVIEALRAALFLEHAVTVGNSTAARQAFEQLVAAQRQGHQMFRPGRDDVGPRNGRQRQQGQDQGGV